ncbi:ABC transporter permease [Salinibaculum rarum]|uniref:ABC transporter permease n=1 Tax=Salinibaculum rarum TaxID=3058903 RepID=UPI00266021CD|nr:ABC transporter permease [Salinibaculum sp. KK48]
MSDRDSATDGTRSDGSSRTDGGLTTETGTGGGTATDTDVTTTTGKHRGTGGFGGFLTLLRREILRFVRRPRNTFVPPMITNVLYFAVFGVILGGRIDQIAGFQYIVFILPGLIVLGTISNAFENASFSIFHGRWNDYIEAVLTSPLSHRSMVAAYLLSSALRGVLVGSIIAAIGLGFLFVTGTTLPVAHPVYLATFLVLIAVLFAAFGIVGGLWSRDFDYLTVLNQFIIRPLVFFGGVFYALDALPEPYRTISLLNPMVHMVNGVRYGFLGYSDVPVNLALGALAGLTVVVIVVDVWLFKRGYGLVE